MQGRIDRDENEEKKSAAYRYGKKFRSFRVGYKAGRKDGWTREATAQAKCPFHIPSDVLELLKKRARWFAGYDMGYQDAKIKRRKQGKKKKS